MKLEYEITRTSGEDDFTLHAVDYLKRHVKEAIERKGSCVLGLSGGSTPKPIYKALAAAEGIDWEKVHVFLVDERYIANTNALSNHHLVKQSFVGDAANAHFHLPDTALSLHECVAAYKTDLEELFRAKGNETGSADIVTLGLGPDGHLASLFPPLSPEHHMGRSPLVVTTETDEFDVRERISISIDTIVTSSRRVFFLKGENKETTWREMEAALVDAESITPEIHTRWPASPTLPQHSTFVIACGWAERSAL